MKHPPASGGVLVRAVVLSRYCAALHTSLSFCASAEHKENSMGRKVHPIGFRLGINQPWGGRWFAEGAQYRQQLHQDFAIRALLLGKFSKGGAAADEKVRKLRSQMPDA